MKPAATMTSAEMHALADELEQEGVQLQEEGRKMILRARAARATASILYRQEVKAS